MHDRSGLLVTHPGFKSEVGDSLIFVPGNNPNAFVYIYMQVSNRRNNYRD